MTRGFVGACVFVVLLQVGVASVAGIDLGDESFKVGVWEINMISPGSPFEIVENTASQRKTSTALHFGDLRQYGGDAMSRRASKPELTFFYLQDFITAKSEGDLEHRYISNTVRYSSDSESAYISAKYRTEQPQDYRVQQLLAMILNHAKTLMETKQGSSAPIDVTITIPSHYGIKEREMILDAAEIAGLKVLFLVHENTAAAIAYAISRPVSNDTDIFMYYNMGATSTKVSLVEYATSNKKKDPVLFLRILGEVSVDDMGGRAVDIAIADLLMDRYNALEQRKGKADIRENKRVVQRFLKEAKKVKEILSSNINGKVHMTDVEKILYKDVVTREEVENALPNYIAGITKPIKEVLELAGLGAEDVNQIELLGGGIRMPRVQAEIQKFFENTLGEKQTIGTHLNGDEAMCHGAAFIAANATATRFKVKDIKLTQQSPFEYYINITNVSEEEAEVKTRKLFSKNTPLGARKKLTFFGDADLEAVIYVRHTRVVDQVADIVEDVQEPQPVLLFKLTLPESYRKKVQELKQQDKYGNTTKTLLKFELTRSGTVGLMQAQVQYQEIKEVSKRVKKEVQEEEEEKQGEAANKEDEEKTQQTEEATQEKAEEKKEEKEEGQKEGQKEGEEEKQGEEGEEKKEEKKEKKEKKKKKYEYETVVSLVETKRVQEMNSKRIRLTKNLSGEEIKEIKAHLQDMNREDKVKIETSETLSNLEAKLYQIRDNLEGVKKYAGDEEYVWLSDAVVKEMMWLEEEGYRAMLEEIKEKKREIDLKWMAIHNRKQTHDELPPSFAKGFEMLKMVEGKLEKLKESRDWLDEKDLSKVTDVMEEVETYLKEKKEELEKLESHETPSTRASVVESKIKRVKEAYKKLEKKKKPAERKPGQYITVDGEEVHIDDFNNQYINVGGSEKKKKQQEADEDQDL